MGELTYIAATTDNGVSAPGVAESMRRYARSIELCDDYLRGYYGLKLVWQTCSESICLLTK
jgi:ER membrane protein complex subunit 2